MTLAEDILHERVFTSNHIYGKAEDEDEALDQMIRVFTAENLEIHLDRIKGEKNYIGQAIFYQYLHFNLNPDPESLPIFKEAEFIPANEAKIVIDEIKRLAEIRMRQ